MLGTVGGLVVCTVRERCTEVNRVRSTLRLQSADVCTIDRYLKHYGSAIILVMSVRLPRGRADEIRALLWRLGLLDSSYAYQVLAYKKEDMVAEYMNIAEFGYPFWGHVEEFLMQLLMRPIVGFQWVDDVLLPDAMAIRLYEACQASWGGACYAARLCFLLHRYFILSEFMGNPAMGKS